MSNKKPLVATLSGVDWIGHAVLRQLAGRGLDVTLISSDSDDSALMRSWLGRELVIVVDPLRSSASRPGRLHRFVLPRPAGRLIVFTVEVGDGPPVEELAREVAEAVVAEAVAPVTAVRPGQGDALSTRPVARTATPTTRWDLHPVRL